MNTENSKQIFTAGRQAIKVRVLIVLSFLLFHGSMLLLARFLQSPSSEPFEYIPGITDAVFAGALLVFIGLVFFIGMLIYGSRYIVKAYISENQTELIFYTISIFRLKQYKVAVSEIMASEYRRGEYKNSKFTVNAPWYWIQLKKGNKKFLLDAQGTLTNDEKILSLLKIK